MSIFTDSINPRDLRNGVYWAKLRNVRRRRDGEMDSFGPIERGHPVLVRLSGSEPCLSMKFIEYPDAKVTSENWQHYLVWLSRVEEPDVGQYAEMEREMAEFDKKYGIKK